VAGLDEFHNRDLPNSSGCFYYQGLCKHARGQPSQRTTKCAYDLTHRISNVRQLWFVTLLI
jgi:hypothetical protein